MFQISPSPSAAVSRQPRLFFNLYQTVSTTSTVTVTTTTTTTTFTLAGCTPATFAFAVCG